MFILTKTEDTILIQPQYLQNPRTAALIQAIEELYLDRIIPDVGLVVSHYDVLSVSGGTIFQAKGSPYYKVVFRLVVFRPFAGEILVGEIYRANKDGLIVWMGQFFKDIFIPDFLMQEPSFYDHSAGTWKWKYDDQELFLYLKLEIRFRVEDVKFPKIPTADERINATGEEALIGTHEHPFAPMQIIGAINAEGLGLVEWWTSKEEDDEEDEDDVSEGET